MGTDTLAGSEFLAPSLRAPLYPGVLMIKLRTPLQQTQRKGADTFAALAAIALERVPLRRRRAEGARRYESERPHAPSALSHDLRTPLAALVGLAESLASRRRSPERSARLRRRSPTRGGG
jgi:two-component system sensor histidine kinase KdpD